MIESLRRTSGLFGIAMGDGEPIIERVPVSSIRVDTYQGDLVPTRVRNITSKFDASIFQPITTSLRENGDIYVMDGKHRLAAARTLGHASIVCVIYDGLSYEDEARFFAETQRTSNRRALSALELFKARIEYGEPQARSIMNILDHHGIRLTTGASTARSLKATAIVDRIYMMMGPRGVDDVLSIVLNAWPDHPSTLHFAILDGVSEFWVRYRDQVVAGDLSVALSHVTPTAMIAEGRDITNALSSDRGTGVGMMALKYYNKGRRANRLGEWKLRRGAKFLGS